MVSTSLLRAISKSGPITWRFWPLIGSLCLLNNHDGIPYCAGFRKTLSRSDICLSVKTPIGELGSIPNTRRAALANDVPTPRILGKAYPPSNYQEGQRPSTLQSP